MGKSFNLIGETKKKEGMSMTSEISGRTNIASSRVRLHSLIDSDVDADVLRHCLKDWDAKRSGMRESLPGDRRR